MKCTFLLFIFPLAVVVPAHAITVAQLALGGGYEAALFVTNKTPFQWTGELRPCQKMNQKWTGAWSVNGQDLTGASGLSVTLDARQTAELVLRGDNVTRSGYLDLNATNSSSSYSVAVAYFYGYYSPTGQLLDTVGSPESQDSKKFFFPAEVTQSIDTGMAWCPWLRFSNTTFPIIVSAYDQSGQLVAQRGRGRNQTDCRRSSPGRAAISGQLSAISKQPTFQRIVLTRKKLCQEDTISRVSNTEDRDVLGPRGAIHHPTAADPFETVSRTYLSGIAGVLHT